MLSQLIGKLFIKAFVLLLVMAGIMTYGVYLKGGDAGGMWKKLASGALGSAGETLSRTKDDAVGFAGNLTAGGRGGDDVLSASGKTEVFTWKDADGVTHFGTSAPNGVSAKTLSVDPNANVLAPVVAPRSFQDKSDQRRKDSDPAPEFQHTDVAASSRDSGSRRNRTSQADGAVQNLEAEMGGPLPGFAGQILSSSGANGNGTDPSQLIRLLQSAGGN